MAEVDFTNIAKASISTPASGVSALFFDTDKNLTFKDDAGNTVKLLDSQFTSIATSGGTTTLVNSSPTYTIFTGTSAQTLVLPDATTLVVGQRFQIDNDSTLTVTVNTNGGAGLWILAANGSNAMFICTSVGTAAGTWDVDYLGLNVGTGDMLTVPSGGGTAVVTTGTQNITGVKTMTNMTTAAGTNAIPAMTLTHGTNLTSAVADALENDAIAMYGTTNTTDGRALIPLRQDFRLTANGTNVTTIANFFGATSNISLVASAYYDIEIMLVFTKTTTEIMTVTLTNSAAPTAQNIHWEQSPITGMVAPPGTATALVGFVQGDATAAKAIAAGSLTTAVNHFIKINIQLKNGTGTSLKIQCANPAGSITPLLGSYWRATRIPTGNTGTFAA